jgi:hypothetical protein
MNSINMTGDSLSGQLGIMEASLSTMTHVKPIMESSEIPDDVKELVIRLIDGLNRNTTMDDDTQGRNELKDASIKLRMVVESALKNLESKPIFSAEERDFLYDGTEDFFRELRAKGAETAAKLKALEGILRNNTSDLFIIPQIKDTDAALILQNPEVILYIMSDYVRLIDAVSKFKFDINRTAEIEEEGVDLISKKAEALVEEFTNSETEA